MPPIFPLKELCCFHFNIMEGTKMLVYNFEGTRQYIISFLFVQNKENWQVFIRIAIKSEAVSRVWAAYSISKGTHFKA